MRLRSIRRVVRQALRLGPRAAFSCVPAACVVIADVIVAGTAAVVELPGRSERLADATGEDRGRRLLGRTATTEVIVTVGGLLAKLHTRTVSKVREIIIAGGRQVMLVGEVFAQGVLVLSVVIVGAGVDVTELLCSTQTHDNGSQILIFTNRSFQLLYEKQQKNKR